MLIGCDCVYCNKVTAYTVVVYMYLVEFLYLLVMLYNRSLSVSGALDRKLEHILRRPLAISITPEPPLDLI